MFISRARGPCGVSPAGPGSSLWDADPAQGPGVQLQLRRHGPQVCVLCVTLGPALCPGDTLWEARALCFCLCSFGIFP